MIDTTWLSGSQNWSSQPRYKCLLLRAWRSCRALACLWCFWLENYVKISLRETDFIHSSLAWTVTLAVTSKEVKNNSRILNLMTRHIICLICAKCLVLAHKRARPFVKKVFNEEGNGADCHSNYICCLHTDPRRWHFIIFIFLSAPPQWI